MDGVSRKCRITGQKFVVSGDESAHLRRMGELNPQLGELLPLPRVHPFEHLRQLLALGNLNYLYRSQSGCSGKPQLSRYNPDYGYKICTLDEFWSERIDNTEFGAGYDFTRPFFEQFDELLRRVYMQPLNLTNAEGSDYVNGANNVRNCYLCFSVAESQDCFYCIRQYFGNDNAGCVGSNRSQFCYDCVDIDGCCECHHGQDLRSCGGCFGCFDCAGCKNCVGCVGLRSTEFCIFNEQKTKKEYEQFLQQYNLGRHGSRMDLLERCAQFIQSFPHQPSRLINAEDCSGSYITNSKNLHQCCNASTSQDCGYMVLCNKSKDCWRGFAINSELAYASLVLDSYNNLYSYSVFGGGHTLYSWFLYQNCAHCFGCAFLRGKSYCVLNKQYTKDEYLALLPRIAAHMKATGEWGEFFPPAISPHAYGESWTGEFLAPIASNEAARRGYRV
ncbi:MAG TPA: hypothetical protein PLP17_06705, partial [Oligoflexia bacterium]|nr:hypothetical protein [Oligoflexia bacterium]